jgi:hypothetical protein
MLNANSTHDVRVALASAASGGHQTPSQSFPSSRHKSALEATQFKGILFDNSCRLLFKPETRPLNDLIHAYFALRLSVF